MPSVAECILSHLKSLPEGTLIGAMGLLHLGNRPAVDQALKRLYERSELMRPAQGLYVLPVKTRFGTRAPAAEKVVEGLAAARAETIVPHGAAAANRLGLTTQVPSKLVYLTSGPNRQFKLGAQTIEIKHAPQWMLLPTKPAAGQAVRALEWLGERGAGEALSVLKYKLPESTLQDLLAVRPALPPWMSKSISKALLANG